MCIITNKFWDVNFACDETGALGAVYVKGVKLDPKCPQQNVA